MTSTAESFSVPVCVRAYRPAIIESFKPTSAEPKAEISAFQRGRSAGRTDERPTAYID